MKNRIAFFIPSLNFGGIEANTIRLAKAFLKDGYDVDLLVGRAEGHFADRIPSNINIIDFKRKKVYLTILQLIRYMRTVSPSAIISGGEAPNIVLIMAKILSLKTNIKVIVSLRTHLSSELEHSKQFNKKVLKFLGKYLYHFADEVVCVSKGVAKDASEIFGIDENKLTVIYNPIIDESIEINMNKAILHPWLREQKCPVILGVGRLVPQKNFLLLIRAFSVVIKSIDAKLIIVGEGPEREKLEEEVLKLGLNHVVDLVGYKANPYVYMKNSDIFVLSSKWEGFGNVIVEAMACGMEIVSTHCPSGPSEILDNGKYGVLVENNNIKELADAIQMTLSKSFSGPKANISRAYYFSAENAMIQYKNLIENNKC